MQITNQKLGEFCCWPHSLRYCIFAHFNFLEIALEVFQALFDTLSIQKKTVSHRHHPRYKKAGCDSGTMFLNTQPACTVAGPDGRQPATLFALNIMRTAEKTSCLHETPALLALRRHSVILNVLQQTWVVVILNKSPRRSHPDRLFRAGVKYNSRKTPSPFAHTLRVTHQVQTICP